MDQCVSVLTECFEMALNGDFPQNFCHHRFLCFSWFFFWNLQARDDKKIELRSATVFPRLCSRRPCWTHSCCGNQTEHACPSPPGSNVSCKHYVDLERRLKWFGLRVDVVCVDSDAAAAAATLPFRSRHELWILVHTHKRLLCALSKAFVMMGDLLLNSTQTMFHIFKPISEFCFAYKNISPILCGTNSWQRMLANSRDNRIIWIR